MSVSLHYLTVSVRVGPGSVERLHPTRLAEHVLGSHGVEAVCGQVFLSLCKKKKKKKNNNNNNNNNNNKNNNNTNNNSSSSNNNNNNNNNNNRIQTCNSRFFTIFSLHREPCPTRTLKWSGRSRVQITCNTSSVYSVQHVMLCATWYEGTAQLLSLTEFKSHLFEL